MTAELTPEARQLLAEIRAAHHTVRGGAITDEYERGRVHALDDVARTLLPLLEATP